MIFSIATISALLLVASYTTTPTDAFVAPNGRKQAVAFRRHSSMMAATTTPVADTTTDITEATDEDEDSSSSSSIRAPLKYMGPYPTLGLYFPNLATANQQKKGERGISLDFVVDTAANINTLQAQVGKELKLDVVGQALPGVTASGTMAGADTYLLGDCQLEGIPDTDFMTNLTASGLPVASPGGAGLLSKSFLDCFESGVEFTWGQADPTTRTVTTPPSITFHGDDVPLDELTVNMTRVPIESIPITLLPSVTVSMNGVEMPALLDTGSPITVLNHQAAKVAGVETISVEGEEEEGSNSWNPFAKFARNLKKANAEAQAAARGDVLRLAAGADGKPVSLLKSSEKVDVTIGTVECGKGNIFVGDIPGLAALQGLGVDSPPAVVLGMDVLRTRPRMLYRGQSNEIYL